MRDNYLKGRIDRFEFPWRNFHRLFLLPGRLLSQDLYKADSFRSQLRHLQLQRGQLSPSSKSYTLPILLLHHSSPPNPHHSYIILFLNSFMSSICHYLRFSFVVCPSLSQYSISSMEAGALPVCSIQSSGWMLAFMYTWGPAGSYP